MTTGWCSRTVRAAVFAAVCVLLAALGHVLMSGADVPAWVLAAGVTGTGAVGWGLAGRERGLPLIVTAVVVVQTVLHQAFSLAQTSPDESTAMGMHMDMDMGMDAGMGSMHMGHPMYGGGGGVVGSSSYGMLAAHLLAALLTGLWLAYGEKAAFRILRAVAARLAAPLRLFLALPTPADRPRVRRGRPRSDRAPALRLLIHAITSRGPPVGPAVG